MVVLPPVLPVHLPGRRAERRPRPRPRLGLLQEGRGRVLAGT